MSKKEWQTAAEFMAELQAKPEFQKRRAEKDEKRARRKAEVDELLRPILEDLRHEGIVAESIQDVTQKHAPLPPQVTRILLDWLPRVHDDRIKESLIRSLGAAREPFDGRLLVETFMCDASETLRWPIANTMAEARPFGIADWLVEAVQNRAFGAARQMLVLALARIAPPDVSLPILLSVLDELPGHVAIALGEIGQARELHALQARIGNVEEWEKAEFLKAMQKIESRLRGTI